MLGSMNGRAADPEVATILSDEIRAHTTLDLVDADALPAGRTAADFRQCAGSPACFMRLAQEKNADFEELLVLSVDEIESQKLVSYRRIAVDPSAGAREVELGTVDSQSAEDTFTGLLLAATRKAFASIWDKFGRIQVDVKPDGALVSVAGKSCISPCAVERVVVGRHDLEVHRDGYSSARISVEVAAGSTALAQAELTPEESLGGSPWIWAAASVAVVAGAITAIVLVTQSSPARTCVAPTPAACP